MAGDGLTKSRPAKCLFYAEKSFGLKSPLLRGRNTGNRRHSAWDDRILVPDASGLRSGRAHSTAVAAAACDPVAAMAQRRSVVCCSYARCMAAPCGAAALRERLVREGGVWKFSASIFIERTRSITKRMDDCKTGPGSEEGPGSNGQVFPPVHTAVPCNRRGSAEHHDLRPWSWWGECAMSATGTVM